MSAVTQELGYLPLPVLASTIDAGNILYNVATFQWLHYRYKAVVTVSTPSDTYDTVDDVGDAVRGAFEDIAGPSPDAVQSVLAGHTAPVITDPSGTTILPDLGAAIQSDFTKLALILGAAIVAVLLIEHVT